MATPEKTITYKPEYLTADQERDILRQKVTSLENDRLQQGLEAQALVNLGDLNEAEDAERRGLARGIERLDARIAVHKARLQELG